MAGLEVLRRNPPAHVVPDAQRHGSDAIDRLERAAAGDHEQRTLLLGVVTIARCVVPEIRDLDRARSHATTALENGPDALGCAHLAMAEVQRAAGRPGAAIATLEEAMTLPRARFEVRDRLEALRRDALPLVPTFASIDRALETIRAKRELDALDPRRERDRSEDDALRAYLDALRFARQKLWAESVVRLKSVVEDHPRAPEPRLALASVLEDRGDLPAAEASLRESFDSSGDPPHESVIEAWFRLAAGERRLSARELLDRLPEADWCRDLRWALETIERDAAIRIQCGGDPVVDPGGDVWHGDVFFTRGGDTQRRFVEIEATESDRIYQELRWFDPSAAVATGYRIPLPAGSYRVRLHCARLFPSVPKRVMTVQIERTTVLDTVDVNTLAPLRNAVLLSDHVARVDDGFLDIELEGHDVSPCIAAIEVEIIR